MYSASNYRSMARRALKNYWWLAVGVTLLASLLGGTSSGFTPSFSLTVNGDDLTQYYPEALRHALRVFLPVSGWPKTRTCRPRRPLSAPRRSWTGERATCSAST